MTPAVKRLVEEALRPFKVIADRLDQHEWTRDQCTLIVTVADPPSNGHITADAFRRARAALNGEDK